MLIEATLAIPIVIAGQLRLIAQQPIPPSFYCHLFELEAHETVSTHESTVPACKDALLLVKVSSNHTLQALLAKSAMATVLTKEVVSVCALTAMHALGQRNVVEVLEDGAMLPSQMQ